MERKSIPFVATKIDEAKGIVEHIIAVMGNVDYGKDVIHLGAFTKTISERGLKVRVLDQHRADSVMRALGKPVELREIGREELPQGILAEYPDATGALLAKTQFLMDTPEGEGAFKRIKQGAISEWSFGYDVIQSDFSKRENGKDKAITVRNLRELKLYEYSPVLFGMNPATQTLDAKAVSGKTSLPLGPRDREWDETAADRRVREWADAEEEPNAKYRQAFFWYDAEAPDNFGSYKLGFADVIDGELTAIPRGIFAVAGGRGVDRADIPEADKEAIKTKVNHYYERMQDEFDDDSLVSPFEKSGGGSSEQKDYYDKPLGSSLQAAVYYSASNKLSYWLACGYIDAGELAALTANILNAVNDVTAGLPEELVMRETEGYYDYGYMSADIEAQAKAGRTISKRNEDRLRSILTELTNILNDAGIVIDEPEPLEDASSHLVGDEEEHPKPKNAPDKQAATKAGPEDVVPPTFDKLTEEHELLNLRMEVQ